MSGILGVCANCACYVLNGALCLTITGSGIAAGVGVYEALAERSLYKDCCYGKGTSDQCQRYSRHDWCNKTGSDEDYYWKVFGISLGVFFASCLFTGVNLCAKKFCNARRGYSQL